MNQVATMWEATLPDNYSEQRVKPPKELKVRWDESIRLLPNPEAANVTGDVTCYVSQSIRLESIMRLGPKLGIPNPPDKLYKVVDYREVPNTKGTKPVRIVTLTSWRKALPTTAF